MGEHPEKSERIERDIPSVPPKPLGAIRGAQRWLTVNWYRGKLALGRPHFWVRLVLTLGQIASLAIPLFKAGFKTGFFSCGTFVVIHFIKHWREAKQPNLPMAEQNHAQRSALLYRLVSDLQQRETLTDQQIGNFQSDVLRFIAGYVRDYRRDSKQPTIFANLLISDGSDLVVIARDRDHRIPMARYPKGNMLAWAAIQTGNVQVTGDVYVQFPETPKGKKYASILAIPIFKDNQVVAAISIDSSSRYHFDLEAGEIVDHLAPYVCMLGWTLSERVARYLLPSGQTLEKGERDRDV